jgi:Glycosyl hydrolases family 18
VLTIQRFAWTAPQARRTVALLTNPKARTTLAQEIAKEISDRGVDGVNLDFEPVPAEVRDDFTTFVRELRTQLDNAKAGLQITFDTTTGVGGWDLPALTADDAADAALVMGYDYRTAGAPIAGSVDPIVSTSAGSGLLDTLDATLAQISPDRIILALPWYGRAWSTTSDQPDSGTQDQATYGNSVTTEYADAIALARQYGRNYDVTEGSAWTAYRKKDCATCPETWRQLWYDDVDSMQAKQKLAIERGLRGLGVWALGDDAALPEAWSVLSLTLNGGTDNKTPSGTAKVDPAAGGGKHGDFPVVNGDTLALLLVTDHGVADVGTVFVRISAAEFVEPTDHSLVTGITYPAWPTQIVPLADQRLGTGFAKGAQKVFVQWRDIAGNWSVPVSVNFWLPSAVSVAPSPLPSAGD